MTTKKDHNTVWTIAQYEIIKSIAKGKCKITLISKDIKKDKSTIGKTLVRLINKGLVKKKYLNSKITDYYLTPKCKQLLGVELIKKETTTKTSLGYHKDHNKKTTNNLRMEYIGVKFKILNLRDSWKYGKERPIALRIKDIEFNEANLKNNNIYSFTDQDINIKFTSRSVIVNFPEESIENPTMMWLNIIYRLGFIVDKIERDYNIELSDEIQVCSQEVADIKNAIANISSKLGNDKYYVFKDPKTGLPRWKLDKSKGWFEFETMNRLFADEDFERLNRDLFYDFVDNDCYNLSETTVKIEGLESEKNELQINQENISKILYSLVDTTNLLRERTFNPLEELKKKVNKIEDVIEYSSAVELLNDKQKIDFEEWLIQKLE